MKIAQKFVDLIGRGFGWEYVAIFRVARVRKKLEVVAQYDGTRGKKLSVPEEAVLGGRFRMPEDERLDDRAQEKLLLIAMIEDLLRYEIALREQGDDGAYLIFPSQSTRENPELPAFGWWPEQKEHLRPATT